MCSPEKRRFGCLLLLWLGSVMSASAQQRETVVVPDPVPATIRLIRVSPRPNAAVSKQTIVEVELAYKVEQFQQQRFQIRATVAQNRPGHSWSVQSTNEDRTMLPRAEGQITVQFALASIWDKDDVKVPIEITFSVHQLFGTMGASIMTATTTPVIYPIEGQPPVAAPDADELMREPVSLTYDATRGMTLVLKHFYLFQSRGAVQTALGLAAEIPGREVVKPPSEVSFVFTFMLESDDNLRPPPLSILSLSVDGRQLLQRTAARIAEETNQGVYMATVMAKVPIGVFAELIKGKHIDIGIARTSFNLTQSQLAAFREFAAAIKLP